VVSDDVPPQDSETDEQRQCCASPGRHQEVDVVAAAAAAPHHNAPGQPAGNIVPSDSGQHAGVDQATSSKAPSWDISPRSQPLLSSGRTKTNLIDTAYMPETS
jgi:hypothetical protein